MGRTHLALGFVVGLAACNPYGSEGFSCETDQECGSNGKCEQLTGFCSFPDESCGEGGRRYGEHAGPRSNDCANPDIQPIIDAPPEPDAPPTCEAGVRECFGNAIETCKTSGLGFDPDLRVPCALACDASGGAPQCLAASNISVSEQLACGTGTDGALDLQAPSGAVVTLGATEITCTGCNGGVTSIPARGTTPNVWYCLKTFTLATGAELRANNVGPVTLFVAGQTQIDANIEFDGDNANGVSGGRGIGPGANNGASNPTTTGNGNSGAGSCSGGGGQRVGNTNPLLVTAGGGGGAGAAGDGGSGGDGNGPMQDVGQGGGGGDSSPQCDSQSFATLFGGSGGGSGGSGDCSALGVPYACGGGGGGGGGAIHIATRATLMGSGNIDVAGGNGGSVGNGPQVDAQSTGGGGGAGGMIFLEAPSVSFTGGLDTRGGDGGRNGGQGAENGLDGQNGGDGNAEGDGGRGGGGAAGRVRINAVSGASCGNAQPQNACATGPLRLQ